MLVLLFITKSFFYSILLLELSTAFTIIYKNPIRTTYTLNVSLQPIKSYNNIITTSHETKLFTTKSSPILTTVDSTSNHDNTLKEEQNRILHEIDTFLRNNVPNLKEIQYNILQKIDESYRSDLEFCSSFVSEENNQYLQKNNVKSIPKYCHINVPSSQTFEEEYNNSKGGKSFLAISTIDESNPILNKASIQTIIDAAESVWFDISENDNVNDDDRDKSKSRFTYQRKGNYEAHTVDLAKSVNKEIYTIMNDALKERIYPMVRDAFRTDIPDINEIKFCVYDSLIIRYNSTEAMEGLVEQKIKMDKMKFQFKGAGQPLHRDLGLVSVNIMLNADTNFEGGGTFFEEQLLPTICCQERSGKLLQPLKPIGVGQALGHLSSNRHAGAATTRGVRDIMVIFLSAKQINESNIWVGAPKQEVTARLKSKARELAKSCNSEEEGILHRIISHRLAIENVPYDGEAWHYLGMAYRDYVLRTQTKTKGKHDKNVRAISLCISCLKYAVNLTPCDGRLSNNLGLSLETLHEFSNNKGDTGTDFVIHPLEVQTEIINYYERSRLIHDISKTFCDVQFDSDMTCLNEGLYLSKQDRFNDATEVLSCFEEDAMERSNVNINTNEHMRIEYDGRRLYQFCKARC